MSSMNWKTARIWAGSVIAIRKGEYIVDKQPLIDEDQYYVTHGKKLIGVCNEAGTAKQVVEQHAEQHENGDGV